MAFSRYVKLFLKIPGLRSNFFCKMKKHLWSMLSFPSWKRIQNYFTMCGKIYVYGKYKKS